MTLSAASDTERPAKGYASVRFLQMTKTNQLFDLGFAKNTGTRNSTHRIAPAAVLGPNHSPTSLPSCLPTSAIRWTENGAYGDGSSRNHERIRAYVA